jgi:hypothetical protein
MTRWGETKAGEENAVQWEIMVEPRQRMTTDTRLTGRFNMLIISPERPRLTRNSS